MDPQYLLIEDFCGHRRSEIDCTAFSSALIVGQRGDDQRQSNGEGKTTIFYAIEYALFGVVVSETIDEIVRDGCDFCSVTFDFSIKEGLFRVVRIRRRKSKKSYLELYRYEDQKWVDISNKTPTETQTELLKLIKISNVTFRSSVLFSQSDLTGLVSEESPDKRQTILKEAIGLSIYKNFEKLASVKIKALKDKVNASRAIVENYGDPSAEINSCKEMLLKTTNDVASLESSKVVKEDLLKQKQKELWDFQQMLSSDVIDVQSKLTELRELKSKTQNKISANKKICETKTQAISKLTTDLANKLLSKTKLAQDLETIKALETRELSVIEEDLKSLNTSDINGKSYVRSLKLRIEELNQPVPDEDLCKYCKQKITPEHRKECNQRIAEEVAQLNDRILASEKKLGTIKNKKSEIEQEISSIKSRLNKISSLESSISFKDKEIDNDNKYLSQVVSLKDNVEKDLESDGKYLLELNAREQSLMEMLDKISVEEINKKIFIIKKDIALIDKDIKDILNNISSQNTYVGIYQEKIRAREEDKVKLKTESKILKDLLEELEIEQIVKRGFSSRGIPSMVVKTILDDFQIETNKLLKLLNPELEIQFSITPDDASEDEDEVQDFFDIKFKIHGKDRSYRLVSGGQKFVFAVALKLALSLVIQRRLGVDIKFLELDEVDQALDDATVDLYMDVIKMLQNNFKIFVITHKRVLKEKFTHAILVEGDFENGATSRLVTSDW